MSHEKDSLLHDLFIMNTGTPKPSERFYKAQINGGWTCEKRFQDHSLEKGFKILPGFMMFTRTSKEFEGRMEYVCVFMHHQPDHLVDVALRLLNVPFFHEVYCVSYSLDVEHWRVLNDYAFGPAKEKMTAKILHPDYEFLQFEQTSRTFHQITMGEFLQNFTKKSRWGTGRQIRSTVEDYARYFSEMSYEQLQSIYAERFFIQVLLRPYSAPMQDFDLFLQENDQWSLVELKQKDANGEPGNERFGWDAHRLALYLYIMTHTGFSGRYIISEIADRTMRTHVQWLSISIEDMLQGLNWGAIMGGTLMLPKSTFETI